MTILFSFFLLSPQPFFFLLNAVVQGPGLQLVVPETGMIPKQKTVAVFLNIYIRIPKGLMPLPNLA